MFTAHLTQRQPSRRSPGTALILWAVVGRFTTNRDLTVVDFTARPTVPSPFDRSRRRTFRMPSAVPWVLRRSDHSARDSGWSSACGVRAYQES